MSNTIQIKHGESIPTINDLAEYELGYAHDGNLYINDNNIIVQLTSLTKKGYLKIPNITESQNVDKILTIDNNNEVAYKLPENLFKNITEINSSERVLSLDSNKQIKFESIENLFKDLGFSNTAIRVDSLNDAKRFGLFISNNGTPSDADWMCLVMPDSSGNIAQIAFRCLASQIFYATRSQVNEVWNEWEFINPYMAVGTEYKTIEKYKGMPVYKKLIEYTNTSTIGTNGTVTSIKIPHGISNFGELVSVTAKQGGKALPYLTTSGYLAAVSTISEVNIIIDTNASWTSRTWEFEIAYTKQSN